MLILLDLQRNRWLFVSFSYSSNYFPSEAMLVFIVYYPLWELKSLVLIHRKSFSVYIPIGGLAVEGKG